eukprot:362866-Chlamydomonas_euryale.AAC.24
MLPSRFRERPRRTWNIWSLDISKQACSAGAGHIVGMTVAIFAHLYSRGASRHACPFARRGLVDDCTLGLTLAIFFNYLVTGLALKARTALEQQAGDRVHASEHLWWQALVEIGNYGDPPQLWRWAIQAVFWMTCVVTARVIVGVVIITSIPVLSHVTNALDKHFYGHPGVYLFTVMVGIPVVVNVGQAWIQDQVLKWKHRQTKDRPIRSMHQDTQEQAVALALQQADAITASGGRRQKLRGVRNASGHP